MDTCAKSNVASYSLYQELRKRGHKFQEEGVRITLADGVARDKRVLKVKVPVTIEYKTVVTTFIVMPGSRDNRTLLGMPFLRAAHIIVDCGQFTWHFTESPQVVYELYDEKFVTFDDSTSIHDITIEGSHSASAPKRTMAATSKKEPKRPYKLIPLALSPPKRKVFDGYAPHFADYMMRDAIENVHEAEICLTPTESSLFPTTGTNIDINSIDITSGTHDTIMSQDQHEELHQLLDEYKDVFIDNHQPSLLGEHRIVTTSEDPISVPPYRLPPGRREILKTEIDKMLREGVIEPCSSPWAAPVVLVPKPNGSIRLCVDYRRLNAITVPDTNPIPRIDDLLHAAKPTPYMTSLDLKAGYWQVKIRPEDEDKTGFITPFGIYRFKRMPFGLRNAPATFQRLIDRFRLKLEHIKILAYLDDIIIFSETFDKHLTDLRDVLQKMREFNLTVNEQKCRFCRSSIKYLGHIITPEGLQTDPEKAKAIADLSPPKTLKHLISFLQMSSWYRRFIGNFSGISEPLTRLTKKNAQWSWGTMQEQAYNELKKRLVSAPILKQANEKEPYILKTDASSYALGAVLVQGEGPEEHPVEYASRLLTAAERNYSTTEREALAVVWALTKFRGYIEGLPVTVVTDHQALKWLMSLKSPTGRLARWALLLQGYDLTIKYQPGRLNAVADALSRSSCDDDTTECGICEVVVEIPTRSTKEIREEQLKDKSIRRIVDSLEEKASREDATYWSNKGYFMNNGMLYRNHPDAEVDDGQLIVPEHEWANVLSVYHDDPLAGHYGAEKTYKKIAKRYFWSGMRKYIESYVKNCINCQRYKPSNQKPAGLLQTTAMNQRFESVAFDLFGPLPQTNDGKTWILIVEDIASRWVELFALDVASAENCATTLINEVFLRYGVSRRVTSDNGTQFVSAVMQQVTFCLNIKHNFTPLYHPEANPVECKNRDLKAQLAILVQRSSHRDWSEALPAIRFAMNTTSCSSTNYTPAYLTFGRELRAPRDNEVDFRQVLVSENLIPEITPKLKNLADNLLKARELNEQKEERRKEMVDESRRGQPEYKPGDMVLVALHPLSKASQGITAKFAPRRDGPYKIRRQHGPTSFEVVSPTNPEQPIGVYHASALTPFRSEEGRSSTAVPEPVQPLRKRDDQLKKTLIL
ncbi:hypothetical protein O0L34_g3683 [Tuta absoluta]|nr:hypothetical protein O0L34_g3683 [Tuta absoluta]